MKAQSVLDTIGSTAHIRLARMFPDHEVWVKSERANPGGSVKDRIALAMIEDAERDGRLKPGGTIIEPTSGNTGIGLAMVAAVKGYKLVLVMPESMSLERRRLMLAYGATFDLTPREGGMKGAIARAAELVEQTEDAWMPSQFDNDSNVQVHVRTTVPEILADFADTPVDVLITGVGTGGHLTACAEELKKVWPGMKGICRGACRFAGHQRRTACSAPDPGHRGGVCSREPACRVDRRRDPSRRRRRPRNGAPVRSRRRAARWHLERCDSGRYSAEAS
jgi:cysteine synthase A